MTDRPTATDNDLGEVTITREFDAPRELMFKAFFDPEQLSRFWGPPGVSAPVDKITIDPRPGGVFATTMVDDASGAEYPTRAVFIEVVVPERFSWREDNGMVTSSTFTDLGGGRTRLVIHQTNAPAMFRSPEALEGFNASLDRMAAHLAEIQA